MGCEPSCSTRLSSFPDPPRTGGVFSLENERRKKLYSMRAVHRASNIFLFAQVAGLLITAKLLIHGVGIKTVFEWLASRHPARAADPSVVKKAARYADRILGRLPAFFGSKCLPRSLVLYYYAVRCGLPVKFHCGVRRADTQLEGHAWLTLHGAPFLENPAPDPTYVATFSFPSA